jgi:hypothetical protein
MLSFNKPLRTSQDSQFFGFSFDKLAHISKITRPAPRPSLHLAVSD